jgi:hypothetical protein
VTHLEYVLARLFPVEPPEHVAHLGPCELWPGSPNHDGYGVVQVHGVKHLVHRWLYEQRHGPIAPLELDHLCRVRLCAADAHLEPVTHAENMARSIRMQRQTCPLGHPYAPRDSSGRRRCPTCRRRQWHEHMARKRASHNELGTPGRLD